jgi:hypothetical protein
MRRGLFELRAAARRSYDKAQAEPVTIGNIMNPHTENQTWVVEAGDRIIQKKAQAGAASLNDWERLVYCLWLADYMMRNAGDFANAVDMYPSFQSDAKQLAQRLKLTATHEAFSLSQRKLRKEYFDRFERICAEIRSVDPGGT